MIVNQNLLFFILLFFFFFNYWRNLYHNKNEIKAKKRKDSIESKNKADTLIYSTEKNLKEYADKISDTDKQATEAAIADLKAAMESEDDFEQINAKTEALAAASMKIGEAMYAANGEAEQETANAAADADAKVVDGEFKDVSDSK